MEYHGKSLQNSLENQSLCATTKCLQVSCSQTKSLPALHKLMSYTHVSPMFGSTSPKLTQKILQVLAKNLQSLWGLHPNLHVFGHPDCEASLPRAIGSMLDSWNKMHWWQYLDTPWLPGNIDILMYNYSNCSIIMIVIMYVYPFWNFFMSDSTSWIARQSLSSGTWG